MANKVVLHIREDYGTLFVKHADAGFLNAEQLQSVIYNLTQLHAQMTESGLTQEQIRNGLYGATIAPLVKAAQLHYPFTHPYRHWKSAPKNRSPKEPRFCGVYFAEHPTKPGCIKIGCSVDIYQRTKALYHEYDKQHVDVIAYIETDAIYEIEEFMHRKFAQFHVEGEWFLRAPIVEWLEEAIK